jgi:hypothetical protein
LFWGYPWDIEDIALAPDRSKGVVLASFRHSIVDDGEVDSPAWQLRVPAVLFVGTTTQPQAVVKVEGFAPASIAALRHRAGLTT